MEAMDCCVTMWFVVCSVWWRPRQLYLVRTRVPLQSRTNMAGEFVLTAGDETGEEC